MKKIFILMLSTLMLLASPALMTYAATGPGLAEKGKGMNVNVTASQNEDGDLVISVSGEQKEEFINLVTQERKYTYKDSGIDYNSFAYGGSIFIEPTYINTSYEFVIAQVYDVDGNKIDEGKCDNDYNCKYTNKKEIIRDGDNLIIKKEIISKKVNAASDTLTLYFWNDNPDEDMHRLLDYEVKVDVKFEGAPEIKKFDLVNYVLNDSCHPGVSTKIDLSGAYLESENGEKIYPYSEENKETYFDIYWAEANYTSQLDSNNLPSKTSDETFQNGKAYSLITLLKYENKNNRIFIDVPNYNDWNTRTTELNFSQDMWTDNVRHGNNYYEELKNAAPIVTGSKYLEYAGVCNDSIDAEDKKMMGEGIDVYEYLIIDNENISEDVSKAFKSYADKNGYVLDEIFNFKTMKNSLYGYLNSPLSGREVTTLGQDAEFILPIRSDIVNTNSSIERIYEVLYIDNNEIKTVNVFSDMPYIDKDEFINGTYSFSFNNKQAAGTYALVYKDTKKTEDAPVIIDGTNLSVIAGDKKDLSFTSNASYSDFKEVKIDGATLDNKNYSVKSGSTIVTLFANYVSTLSVGEHEISIVSTNGTATTKFTVKKKETSPTPTPSTNSDKDETVVATKSYSAKDKNHDGVVTCDEEMNSANWIWSESKKACVYKVANTSAN